MEVLLGSSKDFHKSSQKWSERRRIDTAGLLSSFLRANLQAYDPVFSMTLRYLISIHKGFCFRQGISSPISDLTERLLLEEHDPPATSQESLYEAPPFDEVDIQALAHAVELTRQGAVDSLRFAKGDLYQAFQNELCRMKLDVAMLDELVHEYCVYRGIVDSGLASPSASDMHTPGKSQKMYEPDPVLRSPQDCVSINMDYQTINQSDAETFIIRSEMSGSQEVNAGTMRMDGTDVELRYTDEAIGNHEDCSTSGAHQSKVNRRFQRSRSYATGERSRCKRWRGRVEELETLSDDPSTVSMNHSALELCNKRKDHKYEILLDIKELATKGMAAEVVEEVKAFDPNFFVQNPILLFQLKQVEFLKLVKSGDQSNALRVACSYLGPLAASDPTLLKPLKETLVALLKPNEDALAKGGPLSVLATSLQAAMGRRLGIEEPQLMKIIRATLHTHNEWFRLQMCKDRFEGLLRIDSLKEINTPLLTDPTSKTNADTCLNGASQVTVSSSGRMPEDCGSPIHVSCRDVICDENAILKVMEFLALPRADAISLLAQYNGNAEAVIQQIFG
ncbi:uncharacterized protein LOC122074114 isoform X3 [Macadamia integrifolia]|uniref:uncharacterized protein LOC122074114 isoform X3 n=1 Tax=Macadamia integrifolia TaxID=60698 RepID=UPI001C4E7866|nr:uncharacterized protein LOC122074114 isoform X3 [Macadamia integrifolia]